MSAKKFKFSEEAAVLKAMGISIKSLMIVFDKFSINESSVYAACTSTRRLSDTHRGFGLKIVVDYLITDMFINAFDYSEKERILENAKKVRNGEKLMGRNQILFDAMDLKVKALNYLDTVDHEKFKNMYYIVRTKNSRLRACRVYSWEIRRIK